MQGFDRARPLWEFTVVEGLTDGGAALIVKVHHSITDGVGGMKLQMEMLDAERDRRRRPRTSTCPTPRGRRRSASASGGSTPSPTRRRASSARLATPSGRPSGAVRRLAVDPVGVGTGALRTAASVTRMLKPATEPLSPLMTEPVAQRALRHHPGAAGRGSRQASKVVGGRLNDALRRRGRRRLPPLPPAPRPRRRRRRCAWPCPINVRTAATAIVGRATTSCPPASSCPIGLDDPIARMTADPRAGRPPAGRAGPGADRAARRHPQPPADHRGRPGSSDRCSRASTSSRATCPACPIPVFLGGARMESQIALGPMSGCGGQRRARQLPRRPQHRHQHRSGRRSPDPEVLVECIRDSFDEILKLA